MVLCRFNESTKEWDVVDKADKKEGDIYLDGKLKEKLDFGKAQQKKDFDNAGLVTGGEGSGKSNFAGTIMQYMSNNKFNPLKHIIKDSEHAMEILESIEDEGAVMIDEGYLLFSSTEVLQKTQRDFVKIFSVIRQKRLFVLIVAPSFFRLNSYFALDRTKFLIDVYVKKSERGYFSYYGTKRKEKLFKLGKKNHNTYKGISPTFRGRFTKCDLFDGEYLKIKRETLNEAFKTAKKVKPKTEFMIKQEHLKDMIMQRMDSSSKLLAEAYGITYRRVNQLKNEIRNNISQNNQQISSNS